MPASGTPQFDTTLKNLDGLLVEFGGAFRTLGESRNFEAFARKYLDLIDSLGKIISAQCMQASSARYLASLGTEFNKHAENAKDTLHKLMQAVGQKGQTGNVQKLFYELSNEFHGFLQFLAENDLISKKNESVAGKIRAALLGGNVKAVLSALTEKAPATIKKSLSGIAKSIESIYGKNDPSTTFMAHMSILGVVYFLVMVLAVGSIPGGMDFVSQNGGFTIFLATFGSVVATLAIDKFGGTFIRKNIISNW